MVIGQGNVDVGDGIEEEFWKWIIDLIKNVSQVKVYFV